MSWTSLRDGLDEVIDGGGRAFQRGDLGNGVCGGEGDTVAVATCFGCWYVYAVVAIVIWSGTDIPAVLAVVGPAVFALLFFIIDDDLGSYWYQWGFVEVKGAKQFLISGKLWINA